MASYRLLFVRVLKTGLTSIYDREQDIAAVVAESRKEYGKGGKPADIQQEITQLEKEMKAAAAALEFERAAELRDRIRALQNKTGE